MRELLASSTSRELAEWMAYFRLEAEPGSQGRGDPAEKFKRWAEDNGAG